MKVETAFSLLVCRFLLIEVRALNLETVAIFIRLKFDTAIPHICQFADSLGDDHMRNLDVEQILYLIVNSLCIRVFICRLQLGTDLHYHVFDDREVDVGIQASRLIRIQSRDQCII